MPPYASEFRLDQDELNVEMDVAEANFFPSIDFPSEMSDNVEIIEITNGTNEIIEITKETHEIIAEMAKTMITTETLAASLRASTDTLVASLTQSFATPATPSSLPRSSPLSSSSSTELTASLPLSALGDRPGQAMTGPPSFLVASDSFG